MSLDVTLIICAHNEEGVIGETLDVARKYAGGRFKEIVVVDNASTDKTGEVARAHGARVVAEPRKGLTIARQAGLEATTGELVAYIDADTHLSLEWFDVAERAFRERPSIVAVSGPRRYFGTARWRLWVLNAMWAPAPLVYRIVGYMILGGNFIARRSALLEIGGFDPTIKFYGEDTNIAQRLSKVGKVLFRTDFFVYADARRFEKEGIWKANITYALNYLWPVIFGRPYTKEYHDVRS